MNSENRTRIPGIIYLITVLTGIFSLMYVPGQLIDSNEIPQTLANIQQNELLFRLAIFGELLCYTAFLFLPIALYKHLVSQNKQIAIIMVSLVLVAVPISYCSCSHPWGKAGWALRSDSIVQGTAALRQKVLGAKMNYGIRDVFLVLSQTVEEWDQGKQTFVDIFVDHKLFFLSLLLHSYSST